MSTHVVRALVVLALVTGGAAGARAPLDALAAAARPDGGWTFAHAPGTRPRPHTQFMQIAEWLGRSLGQATWDLVVMRSPGTPAAGLLLLEDGSPEAMDAARRAADLLVSTQLPAGGWFSETPVHGRQSPGWFQRLAIRSTIDDDVTPGAIRFLVATWRATGDPRYRSASERALALLLRAQHVSGGWPLVAMPAWMPRLGNHAEVQPSLNDGASPLAITTLLEAAEALDRPDLLAAAVRGGEWLVAVRQPDAGWSQQYDAAGRPAGARRFEHPALATWESRVAIEALLALAVATDDARWCRPAIEAVRWLERIALGPECWARFHDLESSAPIFANRWGRRVEAPDQARANYSWVGEFGIPALLARLGRRAPPSFGAPLPGDPGTCTEPHLWTPTFRGARLLIADAARAQPLEPLPLGPCAGTW